LSIVVDISVVLAWLFEEDHTPKALEILRRVEGEGMLVPPLWWYELENGILLGERRARRSSEESDTFLKLIYALPIQTDDAPQQQTCDWIITLGRRYRLTAYDAAYLELAVRSSSPLATFDTAIRQSADKLGAKLMPARI